MNLGIYKITSPTGKVYIGQSIDIKGRKHSYKFNRCQKQIGIHRSLNKYGWDRHLFEVIHHLPIDVSQTVLDSYEALYMDFYKSAGVVLLNVREAGSRGKHSESTKELIRKRATGRKASEETKKKMTQSRKGNKYTLGFKHSDKTKKILSELRKGGKVWNAGKSIGKGEENNFFGKKHTDASKSKMSKMKQGENNPMYGKRLSDETKKRIGEINKVRLKGRVPWNKGKKGVQVVWNKGIKKAA